MKPGMTACLIAMLALLGCGREDEPATGREDAATAPPMEHEQLPPLTQADEETVSAECGKGGAECPAGLECVTFRDGQQACGPRSVEAAVLIQDTTLGGGCAFSSPADTYPGASIASVHIVGNDGNVKGYGRLVWEQAGFEVAEDRGTPPDGTGFSGDACSEFYNIGCDGQAVFEIIDPTGEIQALREGEMVIVHLRGPETCEEEAADEVEAAICTDPAAAASGDLSSCTSKVRLVEAPGDAHGPDRMGGTIQYLTTE